MSEEPTRLLELASAQPGAEEVAVHEALALLNEQALRPMTRGKHEAVFRAAVERAQAPRRSWPHARTQRAREVKW